MGLNPPSMPLIHIEQLSKRFGVNAALQDVNLTLEAGSIRVAADQGRRVSDCYRSLTPEV